MENDAGVYDRRHTKECLRRLVEARARALFPPSLHAGAHGTHEEEVEAAVERALNALSGVIDLTELRGELKAEALAALLSSATHG